MHFTENNTCLPACLLQSIPAFCLMDAPAARPYRAVSYCVLNLAGGLLLLRRLGVSQTFCTYWFCCQTIRRTGFGSLWRSCSAAWTSSSTEPLPTYQPTTCKHGSSINHHTINSAIHLQPPPYRCCHYGVCFILTTTTAKPNRWTRGKLLYLRLPCGFLPAV